MVTSGRHGWRRSREGVTVAMNLPHELAWVLQMLDFEWPEVDEDEVQRGASMLRQYGEDLSACIAAMDAIVADQIVPAYETSAGGAIDAAWNDQRSENLGQFVELIDPAAQGMDIVSDAVIALKLKVVAEPVITAAQIAAAIAAAAFTFGASLAAQTGILIARKAALKFATNVAIEQLIVQVIDLIDEPLLNLGMQLVDRILEAPVVADAVGEAESYLVDLAALEAASKDLADAQTNQQTITEDFIAQFSSLQISTAG